MVEEVGVNGGEWRWLGVVEEVGVNGGEWRWLGVVEGIGGGLW